MYFLIMESGVVRDEEKGLYLYFPLFFLLIFYLFFNYLVVIIFITIIFNYFLAIHFFLFVIFWGNPLRENSMIDKIGAQ